MVIVGINGDFTVKSSGNRNTIPENKLKYYSNQELIKELTYRGFVVTLKKESDFETKQNFAPVQRGLSGHLCGNGLIGLSFGGEKKEIIKKETDLGFI